MAAMKLRLHLLNLKLDTYQWFEYRTLKIKSLKFDPSIYTSLWSRQKLNNWESPSSVWEHFFTFENKDKYIIPLYLDNYICASWLLHNRMYINNILINE